MMTLLFSLFLAHAFAVTDERPPANDRDRTLTVFAAASLSGPLEEIARTFEASTGGLPVVINFGGSQQLVQQISHGAAADLLVLASLPQMQRAAGEGLIDTTTLIAVASNSLAIAVSRHTKNPPPALAALADPGVTIILADSSVPAGYYARQMLRQCDRVYGDGFSGRVLSRVVSFEENVRAVLGKVSLGECDAGIVYISDLVNAGDRCITVRIPDSLNVAAAYPAAMTSACRERAAGAAFLTLLQSKEAQEILRRYGFAPPQTTGR